MASVIIGGVFALVGLLGLVTWWADFLVFFRGCFPISLFFGGLFAVIAGATHLNARSKDRE